MTPSKVKKYALVNKIPVVHTEKRKEEYVKTLKKYNPDIAVCKAFGEIVPKEFLDYPQYGCINVHFSLLPKYRGAVPIQKAILEGEKETGISIMLMSEGLDEGDILEVFKERIKEDDTNISLRKRLVKKTTEVLIPTLKKWVDGEITRKPQNDKKATYCWEKDISKEKAQIIWGKHPPIHIERMVRAFVPWPVAWTLLKEDLPQSIAGKRIRIFEAELISLENERDPGELFTKDGMVLFSTRDPFTVLRVKIFQIAGKKRTNEKQFLNGMKGAL
jgi:methionyl-tRNA formyltransferase